MKIALVLLLAAFVCFAATAEVTVLTSENFDDSIATGTWLVKFYAPWCGHCKKLAPTWDELAGVVGESFHVGKVDCTVHKDVCSKFEVRGYPTILLLKGGKSDKFAGQRTINDFINFVQKTYPDTPKTVTGEAPAAAQPAAPATPQPAAPAPDAAPSDVVVLTDTTFDQARTGVWLVDFYAPWCGHCKKLTPIWDELGTVAKQSGLYKVAKVDVTTEKALGSEFGIRSLPTIKLFIDGKETPYSGERTVDAFNKFVVAALAN